MNGLPDVVTTRRDGGCSEVEIVVPADSAWFEGHFPSHPILPGVVQIGWAVHFAALMHDFDSAVRILEQIKFKRPIGPGACLVLRLEPSADRGKLRYDYRDGDASCSSGTLVFGTAA